MTPAGVRPILIPWLPVPLNGVPGMVRLRRLIEHSTATTFGVVVLLMAATAMMNASMIVGLFVYIVFDVPQVAAVAVELIMQCPLAAWVWVASGTPTRGDLLLFDQEQPSQPYAVTLPLDELRSRFGEPLRSGAGFTDLWEESLWVARRNSTGLEEVGVERDQRTITTDPAHVGVVRDWKRRQRQMAKLLVYDEEQPEQPYLVSLPQRDLYRELGGENELTMGGKSMWVARRNSNGLEALGVERDQRTTRTPAYMAEFMRLRADRDLRSRPGGRTQQMLFLGAAVGICITTVAGLILVMALSA